MINCDQLGSFKTKLRFCIWDTWFVQCDVGMTTLFFRNFQYCSCVFCHSHNYTLSVTSFAVNFGWCSQQAGPERRLRGLRDRPLPTRFDDAGVRHPCVNLSPYDCDIPTIYRAYTDHVPTICRVRTDHMPSTYRPRRTDHIQYQPYTEYIPTTYRQYAKYVPSTYRPVQQVQLLPLTLALWW